MKAFRPGLPLPLPSVKQVLWRSGCPPEGAGADVTGSAERAVSALSALNTVWCGGVFLEENEVPGPLAGVFPGKPLSVMAVTLGPGIEPVISDPDPLQGFMNDSAASVAVEALMKKLQLFLVDQLGMTPTKRAAPGYGDLPLSMQPEIIAMFPDSGIVCNDGFMLSPVKSMTGVVGWIQREN